MEEFKRKRGREGKGELETKGGREGERSGRLVVRVNKDEKEEEREGERIGCMEEEEEEGV